MERERGSNALDRWPTVKRCLEMFANLRNEAAFDRDIDRIVHEQFGGTSVPDVLYHYTSLKAFAGIVRSRTIWAFAHDDMKDQKELRALDGVIDEVLADLQRITGGPAGEALAAFAEKYPGRRAANEVLTGLRCFTTEVDSLTHWDKFTEAGEGVCLAIPSLRDEQSPSVFNDHMGLSMFPIEYNHTVWRERLWNGFKSRR